MNPRVSLARRAGIEGDRLPDREGRRQARRRLHARRDPERPHEDDPRELRADTRLRRRQVPRFAFEEVPRRRPHPRDADEVRQRGDGDRTDLRRGVLKAYGSRELEHRAPTPWASLDDLPDGVHPWFRAELERAREDSRAVTSCARSAPAGATRQSARRSGWQRRKCGGSGTSSASGRPTAASTRAPARSMPHRATTTRPGARRASRRPSASGRASSSSAPARTGSGRASSSTTAACTRRSPSAISASTRSWSTATRRPCRPTTTRPTASTSSR